MAEAIASTKKGYNQPYTVKPARIDQMAKAYNFTRGDIWKIKREIDKSLRRRANAKTK